jgi:CRP-like cAMP-binding protein
VRLDEHENALCQLGRGAYFGEIALLQRSKRTSHVIALTLCDLASLSGTHFRYLMRMFPEHEKTIAKIASERNAQVDYHSDEQVNLSSPVPAGAAAHRPIAGALPSVVREPCHVECERLGSPVIALRCVARIGLFDLSL